MAFRISSFAISSQAIRFASRHHADLAKYQAQISSGIQIQRPSDDPISYRFATTLTSQLRDLEADNASAEAAQTNLSASVSQLQEANNLITRARVLTQQGIQTTSDSERNALAIEVEGLLDQMQNIANSQFGRSFLFGGTISNNPPFVFNDSGAEPTLDVTYQGGNSHSELAIGQSIVIPNHYDGSQVFGAPNAREDAIIVGNSGAAVGIGTSNIDSRISLEVTHTSTQILGSSGILSGADTDLDTIIGELGTHKIQVNDLSGDGTSGTVSLNGGDLFQFTDLSSNLKVIGPSGEIVHLDLTNVQHGFSGEVDLVGEGEMTIDGNDNVVPIDFTDEQILETSDGEFVVINSEQVRMASTDHLEFPGSSDIFQVLHNLADDLRNGRSLNNQQFAEALDRRLGELEVSQSGILNVIGEQSSSLQIIENLKNRIDDLQLQTESRLSELQTTNIPEAVLRMENSQVLLEYTYAVTAQINSLGILNFLG